MPAEEVAKVALEPATRTVRVEAVADGDVYAFFEDVPEEHRGELALRALKVGVLALRDARTVAKADYVEKEFQRMRAEFRAEMEGMFGPQGQVTRRIHDVFGAEGTLDRRMEAFFGKGGQFEQLCTRFLGDDGALQRCLTEAVGEDGQFHRVLDEFLGERGQLRTALEREFGPEGGRLYRILDPENATTPLGQFKRTLEERFDPAKEGSAFWELKNDLRAQIQQLRADLGVQEAKAEERAKGTQKGFDFEHDVVAHLQRVAGRTSDRVEHVGMEAGPLGDVGDVVVQLNPEDTAGQTKRIVVEVKDRGVTLRGKESFHKELDRALENRGADVAIGVVEVHHAGSFAPLQYVAPRHVLVAVDKEDEAPLALEVAYKLARALVSARAAHREAHLDTATLLGKLQDINRHLENVQAMKSNLTGAAKSLKAVGDLLDELRDNIRNTVADLERMVREGAPAAPDDPANLAPSPPAVGSGGASTPASDAGAKQGRLSL